MPYTGWGGASYTGRQAANRGLIKVGGGTLVWHGDAFDIALSHHFLGVLREAAEHMVRAIKERLSVDGHGSPSGPGDYPRKQSGALRDSISYAVDPLRGEARVFSFRDPIDRFLEYGTRFMRPRKLIRAAFAEEADAVAKILSRPMWMGP